jgi:hypothetical protein
MMKIYIRRQYVPIAMHHAGARPRGLVPVSQCRVRQGHGNRDGRGIHQTTTTTIQSRRARPCHPRPVTDQPQPSYSTNRAPSRPRQHGLPNAIVSPKPARVYI